MLRYVLYFQSVFSSLFRCNKHLNFKIPKGNAEVTHHRSLFPCAFSISVKGIIIYLFVQVRNQGFISTFKMMLSAQITK